jgi:hypothetical protein
VSAPIVVVTRDSQGRTVADWYEDEDGYYTGDPIATATYDVVHVRRNCPTETASQVFRLYHEGPAGFGVAASVIATHYVSEPGAPLEPLAGSVA